jgi:hypothetical protein
MGFSFLPRDRSARVILRGFLLMRWWELVIVGETKDTADGFAHHRVWNPSTIFLAFTKRYDLEYSEIPENLTIIFSMWPGVPDTAPRGFPRAWMQDGTEDRVPDDALESPGICHNCGMCWQLAKIGRDVVFHKC